MAQTLRAALYLRLSRDDGNGGESESIANQRALLYAFCEKNGFEHTAEYADDGWSGLSFDRPAFNDMIRDIEAGRVNCVITKDLSRLGRDYITTGHYLERYFPSKNVRYIAVNDGIDSLKNDDDMTPFRTVINDLYAKDISKKVRSALDTRRKQGLFIGSAAPYGYKKSADTKGLLVPDEAARGYIESVFAAFMASDSLSQAARQMDMDGVPTPSAYKGAAGAKWNAAMVKRILTNPTYLGSITQNRTKKVSHKLKKRVTLPGDAWITVEGTHEAIIDKHTFAKAEAKLAAMKDNAAGARTARHPLSGLVKCGGCDSAMYAMTSGGHSYLICSKWRSDGSCKSHCIREDVVLAAIKTALPDVPAAEYRSQIKKIVISDLFEIDITVQN